MYATPAISNVESIQRPSCLVRNVYISARSTLLVDKMHVLRLRNTSIHVQYVPLTSQNMLYVLEMIALRRCSVYKAPPISETGLRNSTHVLFRALATVIHRETARVCCFAPSPPAYVSETPHVCCFAGESASVHGQHPKQGKSKVSARVIWTAHMCSTAHPVGHSELEGYLIPVPIDSPPNGHR